MISGIITLIAFGSFIGISIWAWSRRNRPRFDAAARLPLDDGEARTPTPAHGREEAQS